MNDLKRMQQLIITYNEHNHRYYALYDPTISDQEYDATFKKLLELEKKYPEYHISKNKGYGTKEHFSRLKKYGLSHLHRKSFLTKINLI